MKKVHLFIFIIAPFLLIESCSQKQQITEFRGPDRTGIFQETDLLKTWPENGLSEVFFSDYIGDGYGSPIAYEDNIYITGAIDSTAVLHCFDLSGEKIWQLELGPEWVVNYPGSRSAPTLCGDYIYVGTGMGDLFCVDRLKQQVIWQKSLKQDFQGILPRFGHSESPVIFEDMVYWTAGGTKYNVVAMDRFTGDIIWSSEGKGERSGYNHPRVITSQTGRHLFVTFSAYHLMGFDAETGELLWTHEQDNYPPEERKPGIGDTHANTIVFENNYIYYVAGDGNCAVKLELSPDGSEIEELWRNRQFDSYMGGVVKMGDYLYASGTAKPFLLSLDSRNSQIIDSLKIGRGVVIAADSMLYYYSQTGKVHLIAFDHGHFTPVSEMKISKGTREHFSHSLIYKGNLYVRHGNAMIGYNISAEE